MFGYVRCGLQLACCFVVVGCIVELIVGCLIALIYVWFAWFCLGLDLCLL